MHICGTFRVLNFLLRYNNYTSRVVRKPAFGTCENKDADQVNHDADQRLCFRYIDSKNPSTS